MGCPRNVYLPFACPISATPAADPIDNNESHVADEACDTDQQNDLFYFGGGHNDSPPRPQQNLAVAASNSSPI